MSPSIKSCLLATQSDERLMVLVREGHEAAFEALINRYRKPLLRYCRSLCLCEARAEEALQQALLNAWIALRRSAEVRELRPWLYRVAHNASINAMRGDRVRSVEPLGEKHEQIAAGRQEGAPSLDEVLALREVLAGMAALPRMQREVIVRTAVAGHSHEEVASALGITDGAVRGLLYRARASLRAGVSAITPGPLLAWIANAGASGSSSGERIAELAAGGGTAGLGVAIKGGIVAITAGVAITGAVVAHGHLAHTGRPRGSDVARHLTPQSIQGERIALAPALGVVPVTPTDMRTATALSSGRFHVAGSLAASSSPSHHVEDMGAGTGGEDLSHRAVQDGGGQGSAQHDAASQPDGAGASQSTGTDGSQPNGTDVSQPNGTDVSSLNGADASQAGSGDGSLASVSGGDGGGGGDGKENEATTQDQEQALQQGTLSGG